MRKGRSILRDWLLQEIEKATYMADTISHGSQEREGEPSVRRWRYRADDFQEVLKVMRQEGA